MKNRIQRFTSLLMAALFAPALAAQESAPVIELDDLVVEGRETLLRPAAQTATESVYGLPLDALTTPRSLTAVRAEELEARGISELQEAIALAPNTQGPARFGNLTIPNIRGDVADTYFNGQRRSANLFGYQPPFHLLEQLLFVRGPAPAAVGPGNDQGGYVDFISKEASTGARTGELKLTTGTWLPDGDSFRTSRWAVDHNEPLSETWALRVIYEGQEDETIYGDLGARRDYHDFFLNLNGLVGATEVSVNLHYSWQAIPQLMGVNRPTPDLVADGRYFAGPATDPATGPWVILPTGLVELPVTAGLFSPGSFSNADVSFAQVITESALAPQLTLTTRSFVERVDRQRFHETQYAEWVEQETAETRVELTGSSDWGGVGSLWTVGAALRWEDRLSYVNYFNEYDFAFDLTDRQPPVLAELFPGLIFPGLPGPEGRLFFGAAQGSPETTDSTLWQSALFAQQRLQLGTSWDFDYGVRLEHYDVEARDPLPLPGTDRWEDDAGATHLHYHASLGWTPRAGQRLYLTANRSYGLNTSVAGGGVMLFDGHIDERDLRNRSDLLELGWRFDDAERGLQGAVTAYWQQRQRSEFRGGNNDIEVEGIEAELAWAWGEHGFLRGNVTYLDGHYRDAAPVQAGGRSLYDLYAEGAGPEGRGTGVGWDFTFTNQVPRGDWPLTGVPPWSASVALGWRPPTGWGGLMWLDWTDAVPGNLDEEYTIPAQHTLNLRWGYRTERWEVGAAVYNVTDERNWIHNGDTFFNNQLVTRALPRHVEAFARWWY